MSGGSLPSGTVTFLFTDVEGSTRLWAERGAEMREAMVLHDRLLREAIEGHSGYVFTTAGDSFAAAFGRAAGALEAAVALRRAVNDAVWPPGVTLRVRVGLHTGEADERDGDYFGSAVNRAARLMSAAHGGQVVVSAATRDVLVDVPLGDIDLVALGEHSLKDFDELINVFEVVDSGHGTPFLQLRIEQPTVGNLPQRLVPLVGRDGDVAAVLGRLDGRDVVTIVGVGGIGKTELALSCAAQRRLGFEHGVWVCELASVGEPDAVASAVGQVIGARQHPGRSMVDSVAEYCRRRRMLLVLDNCEHVLDAVGDVVEALLDVAPGVAVLATSREALGVDGEQIYPLASLSSVGADAPAVELFIQRADAVAPGLEWGVGDVETIERICVRLDGIPLAIELAAARLRSFGVAEIEEHLDRSFRVLRGGRRSVERHRTLEAAIDWSYEALAEPDRVLFDRLAVFVGGFDLSAAAAVCADGDLVDSDDVMNLLDDLVAKSLLVSERIDGAARFRMLEPVRQYAENRLAASGDADQIRHRHLEHYVGWAEQWRTEIPISGLGWRHRVEREFANLRAAFDWATVNADTEAAARIVVALEFAHLYLQLFEIGEWAERILHMPGIDELLEGPGITPMVVYRRWWLADIRGMGEILRRAEQMPALELDGGSPGPDRTRAFIREMEARAAGDARAAIAAYDDVDRSDAFVDGRVAMQRLAWPSDVLNAEWARPVMDAERRVIDHWVSSTGSALFAAEQHRLRAFDLLAMEDYRAAASEARLGIAAALDVDATLFVLFNLSALANALALSGDDPRHDLGMIARALTEQRDVGQVADQWMLLCGTAGILYHRGRIQLAHDTLRGLLASQGAGGHALTVKYLKSVLGITADEELDADRAPDLSELVDRTLAAIDEVLDERTL